MKSLFNVCVLLWAWAGGIALAASQPRPFEDYQVILTRKPFGDMAAKAEPVPERIVPINESFAAGFRLSGIYELADGTPRVAIVNQKENSYFSLILDEPALSTGITLIEVNFDKREAVIRKDEEIVVLSMDDSANKVLSSEEGSRRLEEAQTKRLSYRERREQRKLARAKQMEEQAAKPRLVGAELEEHLQNYQMEVLRTGMPPLPVQLTPDRDAQLVEEGVLPPQDDAGFELENLEYEQPAGYDEFGPYYF